MTPESENPFEAPKSDLHIPDDLPNQKAAASAGRLLITLAIITVLFLIAAFMSDSASIVGALISVALSAYAGWTGVVLVRSSTYEDGIIPGYVAAAVLVLLGFLMPLLWLFSVGVFIYLRRAQRDF